MPFFGKIKTNKSNKANKSKTTLRAKKYAQIIISLSTSLFTYYKIRIQKRVSPSASQGVKASITVEAALVFPLFLMAVMNLLSVMDFLHVQSNLEGALHQTGKKLAIYGYANGKAGLELEDYALSSVAFSYTYVKSAVEKQLQNADLESGVLVRGMDGIQYIHSQIMKEDIIDLVALYKVNGMFSPSGMKGVPLFNRFYGHVWNGYDVERQGEREGEEIYVFITKTGSVYHRNRECTYLSPAIESVHYKDLDTIRNPSGEIYYSCELCADTPKSVVYITKQGNRYHVSLNCSGLKRTVYTILLSEVGKRSPCSKCGQ